MTVALTPAAWIATFSARLQQRWPNITPQRLDDLAEDLWRDERLRALPPEQAAEQWLRPVRPNAA